uniref:C2 domain-containing protein n=1 Tax=Acrobeloides nanus TaxID=290746 RepID=A0A914BY18_9BILA
MTNGSDFDEVEQVCGLQRSNVTQIECIDYLTSSLMSKNWLIGLILEYTVVIFTDMASGVTNGMVHMPDEASSSHAIRRVSKGLRIKLKRPQSQCSDEFEFHEKHPQKISLSAGNSPLPKRKFRAGDIFQCVSSLPTIESMHQFEDADFENLCEVPGCSDVVDPINSEKHSTVRQRERHRVWDALKFQFGLRSRSGTPKMNRLKKLKLYSSSFDEPATSKKESKNWRIKTLPNSERTCQHHRQALENSGVKIDDSNPYVTFQLKIHLKEGHSLVVRDASGSSDPYVKFLYRDKEIYKSNTVYRSLNPNWDEEFRLLIDDPTYKLHIKVFDYDRLMSDDFMGGTTVDLSMHKLFDTHELKVKLEEEGNTEYMGYLQLAITITPLTEEQKAQFLSKSVRGVITEMAKKPNKVSVWLSAVNIVLVEAKLNSLQLAQPPDTFVKFKLGNEKYKSKVASKSYAPRWLEQFDLHIYDENFQTLDLMIHEKNTIIGGCSIDLREFDREQMEEKWYQLDHDAGSVLLLLSISGTSSSAGSVQDLNDFVNNRDIIIEKYSLLNSFRGVKDVGHLTVKVFRAENLTAADLGGKSDPFCVLELVNARLQTHTEYKTLNPEWNKLFTFAVKDIHEVLEITVYDEDPNKKFEFLGKVAIPLLKIRNCEKRWYYLKDRKLMHKVKGRILIEMDVVWNSFKAAVRSFNPREKKLVVPETKFKRSLLVNSVNRLKEFGINMVSTKNYVRSCLNWESYPRSICAFIIFVLTVYFIELYHVPILLLLVFIRCHVYKKVAESIEQRFRSRRSEDNIPLADSDDEDISISDQTDKGSSLRDRFNAIQDTLVLIQNILDFLASLLERIKNTFNFTVPYLSYLAIFVLCISTLVLYFVKLRWIVLAWGINKFTKKLRNPHYIDNNELLDFFSRVPSEKELWLYREFKMNSADSTESGKIDENKKGN